jgi:hypothetical protein
MIVDISLINSSLFGLVAKEDISSKYLDWPIAKLSLCLSLFGTLSNSLDFVITSLTFFCDLLSNLLKIKIQPHLTA